MGEFRKYHPAVSFIYFVSVIAFSMFLMHPVLLIVSLLGSLSYSVYLKKTIKFNLRLLLPLMLFAAVTNTLFNHEGQTILAYLPGARPFTAESLLYGVAASIMLASVICWFSCYNEIMTTDKFIYLFGRIVPSASMLLSMALRFAPRFTSKIKAIIDAQKGIMVECEGKGFAKRAKKALGIFSSMISWALENSIETADSMKSRGYGLPGRTAFSIFRPSVRDGVMLSFIIALDLLLIYGISKMHFTYYPSISLEITSVWSILTATAYFILSFIPLAVEFWEALRWKLLKSKI